MKIGLVGTGSEFPIPPTTFGGGIPAHIWHLAREIKKSGNEPHIITSVGSSDEIPIHAVGCPFKKTFYTVYFPLASLTKTFKDYDILHVHDRYAFLTQSLVKKFKGTPIVYTNHFWNWFGSDIRIRLRRSLELYAFKNADRCITVSEGMKRKIVSEGVEEERLIVIPNGVDTNLYRPAKEAEEEGKIASVGRIEHEKGFDVLIKAVNLVLKERECSLYIIGFGSKEQELKELASKLGIESQVKFLGRLPPPEVVKHLQTCSFFALPSRYESFGMVYTEAMACGKPVIGTKTVGPDEVIEDEYGFLVPVDDVNALAEKMLALLEDKELRKKMGRAGRRVAEEKYSWDVIGKRIIKVYEEVLG
jgi:glycosyltransferase involved in cell wall biosynthesis